MSSFRGAKINAYRMLAYSYKNFVWNVKRGAQRSLGNGRDVSKILYGVDRDERLTGGRNRIIALRNV